MENGKEIQRIKTVYEKEKEVVSEDLYSFFNVSNLFIIQRREQELLKCLEKHGIKRLHDKKILDIGCGSGGELRNFLRYGARPVNLYGIDLLGDRIEEAKKLSPNLDFRCGDAANLPYENESLDIIMQFTAFTSILDIKMKKNIALDMIRVLKQNGIILWFDYYMNNPRNPDVRGVKKKEITRLFPDCKIDLKRTTLAPPLTRVLAPYSWIACYLLEKLKIFNTHYIGVISKASSKIN